MNIYYLKSTGVFTEISYTYPVNESTFVDERSNTLQVSTRVQVTFHKNQLFKVVSSGFIRYYILQSVKRTTLTACENSNSYNYQYQTLTMAGAKEIMKQFKVESCAFAEGRYTLITTIQRLLKLAYFDCEFSSTQSELSISNPKLTYQSSNLYNALYEVASLVDLIPDLTFNEETLKFVLQFVRKDGLNGTSHTMSELTGNDYMEEEVGDSIAKEVYTEASNILINDGVNEPSHLGGQTAVTNDDSATLTTSNACIKLEFDIDKVNSFIVYPLNRMDETIIDYNYPLVFTRISDDILSGILYGISMSPSDEISRILVNREHTIRLVSKTKYDSYSEDELNSFYQNNIHFIYYEGNVITLANLANVERLYTLFTNVTYEEGTSYATEVNGYFAWNNANLKLRFQTNYNALVTTTVPMKKINQSDFEGITFYNQPSSTVDPEKMSQVQKSYIDSMSTGDIVASKYYKSETSLIQAGDIVTNTTPYVVTSATYEYQQNGINASFQLNQYHSRKYENASPDTTTKLNEIPNDSIIQRTTIQHDVVEYDIDITSTAPSSDNGKLTDLGLTYFTNPFANIRTQVSNAEITYKVSLNRGDEYGTQLLYDHCLMMKTSDSVIFHWIAEDNVVFKTTTNDNRVTTPYQYVDEDGKCYEVTSTLEPIVDEVGSTSFKTMLSYYPVVHTNHDTYKLMSHTYDSLKDAYERLSYTYELQYLGKNGLILGDEFVNQVLLGNCTSSNVFVYTFEGYATKNTDLSTAKTKGIIQQLTSFKNNNSTIYTLVLTTYLQDFRSVIVTYEVNNKKTILFIKNFNAITSSRVIVLTISVNNHSKVKDGVTTC